VTRSGAIERVLFSLQLAAEYFICVRAAPKMPKDRGDIDSNVISTLPHIMAADEMTNGGQARTQSRFF
jgi:hypothetical protein